MNKIITFVFTMVFITYAANATVVTFVNGGEFEGDGVNDTALLSDGTTVTTLAITPGGATLNENGDSLGPDADTPDRFDTGESWTFSFDKDITLEVLDFDVASSGNETFTLTSFAFDGLTTNSLAGVTYDDAMDSFIFDGSQQTGAIFDLSTISSGAPLSIDSGVAITLSYTAFPGDTATLESFTFTAVPEPSSFALLLLGTFAFGRRKLY